MTQSVFVTKRPRGWQGDGGRGEVIAHSPQVGIGLMQETEEHSQSPLLKIYYN